MISVIVPVYNEHEVIAESYKRIKETMQNSGEEFELVFVNDGSRDDSLSQLKEFAKHDANTVVLSFSRNFGHQNAVSCGMEYCKGDAAVIIDADLQDPPSVILEMIARWKEGYEIVYGKRTKRKGESAFKKLTAFVYYRVVDGLSSVKLPRDAGDFRLIDRRVIDTLVSLKEHNRYLRGMNAWAGFKTCAVEYVREPRFAGETKYTMKKMVKLASDGIISNSDKPLYIALKAGIALGVIGGLGLIALIVLFILNLTAVTDIALANYFIVDAIVLATAIMLVSNGVTNAYVARIYDEVKGRPNYIVSEAYNTEIK